MKRTQFCDQLVRKWEGYHDELPSGSCTAYPDPDPEGPVTIGFGTTIYNVVASRFGRTEVRMGDVISRSEAEMELDWELDQCEEQVLALLTRSVTQGMLDALVSFAYNCGIEGSMLQIGRANEGMFEECASMFKAYVRGASGRPLPGLIARRKEEEALFRRDGLNPAGATPAPSGPQPKPNGYPYKPLELPWLVDDELMMIGDQGEDVWQLHCALMGLGYLGKPEDLMVTDVFNANTHDASMWAQKKLGLEPDGKVGPITRAAIVLALETVRNSGKLKILDVPYFNQYDNTNEPGGTCGLTSCAMLLNYHGFKVVPDGLYRRFGKPQGQSPGGLAQIYKAFGLKAESTYTGTVAQIKALLDAGCPVIVHGNFTRSGHITCFVGYDNRGFYVNDPAGDWSRIAGGGYAGRPLNGKRRLYTYAELTPAIDRDGGIWFSYAKVA